MRPRLGFLRSLWNIARSKPLGGLGVSLAVLLVLLAILADVITTKIPSGTSAKTVEPPSKEAWLGTDELGRDVYTRLVHGSRISLRVGFSAVAIGVTIGFIIGMASAYFGGVADLFVQRIMDAILAFPGLVLVLAIITVLEPSINNVIAALSFGLIPRSARTIRSQALSVKETDYVLAARAVGASHWRIILRHMAPNCLAIYIVFATFSLGFAIIAEASLSFLGLGVPPNIATWGGMLNQAAASGLDVAPWLGVFPGMALAVVVFAWNLMGDALRDELDPRLRGSR
jgi:peptide/nickel transport system permease protein